MFTLRYYVREYTDTGFFYGAVFTLYYFCDDITRQTSPVSNS